MAKQTINIGTTANDGTGDPIRDAMDKINDNFDEVYSSFVMTGAVTVGNATVNSVVSNTGGLTVSNTTANTVVNTENIKLSNTTSNATLTSSSLSISNLAIVNTTTLFIGNSTVNTTHSVGTLQLANATLNTTLTREQIFTGNSTVNTFANSSYLKVNEANVVSNTLMLGSHSASANGYTYLPNGYKMNWGVVQANTGEGTALFTSAYTSNSDVYVVTATSNATGTYAAAVISQNSTVAEIRTANDIATDVYFTVIGR